MKRVKKAVWLLLAPMLLISCWDYNDYLNTKTITFEPIHQTWVIPLVGSTITFREVLENAESNTIVEVDETSGIFYMAFRDTIAFANAMDEFNLAGAYFPFIVEQPLAPGFLQVNVQQTINQSYVIMDAAELKKVDFRSGFFSLDLKNNYQHRVHGTLTITSLVEGGDSYFKIFDLQANSSSENSYPLNGYSLNLFDEATDAYNTFILTLDMTVEENSFVSDYSGNLEFSLRFETPEFELIQGKVVKSLSLSDQAYSIGIFNTTTFANQHFADPYFGLTVHNGYGIPVGFSFSNFDFYNKVSGDVFNVQNEGALGANDLDVSGINQLNFVQLPSDPQAFSLLELHKDNSNIEDAFDNAPTLLRFGALFNLGGDSHEHFIKRNSNITFISDMVLPIVGWAETHEISDTLEWGANSEGGSLSNLLDSLPVSFGDDLMATLKFKVTNELPLDIFLQLVSLIDVDGELVPDYFFFVDELTGEPEAQLLATSALIDTDGFAIDPKSSYLSVHLDREAYDRINQAEYIELKYRLLTGDGGHTNVKVLATNTMKLEMSLILSGTVTVNPIDIQPTK